jgi:hypothetical protein
MLKRLVMLSIMVFIMSIAWGGTAHAMSVNEFNMQADNVRQALVYGGMIPPPGYVYAEDFSAVPVSFYL